MNMQVIDILLLNVNLCLCLIVLFQNLEIEWKKIPCHFINSTLPWAGGGEGPHGIVFSVWFILFLRIQVIGLPSLSLRANSSSDILMGCVHYKMLQALRMSFPGYQWAHELWLLTVRKHAQVASLFPCNHSYTLQTLEGIFVSCGASS